MIDLHDLIEQQGGSRLTKVATTAGGEWAGPCCWCGGRDRLRVWPFSTRAHYWCRVCGKSGDEIQFLREWSNMTYVEACQTLGVDPGDTISHTAPMTYDEDPPPIRWQEMAQTLIERAQNCLWNDKGHHALQYLLNRGLTEETIRNAKLGYVPLMPDGKWFTRSFADWGLTDEMLTNKQREKGNVKVPPGILLPWVADNQIYKLAVKRFEAGPNEMRYGQITGSRDALYNADVLQRGKPALLCESELDTLSAEQSARDIISTIGTGSTAKARIPLWIARMSSLASVVLLGFDNDENGAGGMAAAFWHETLSNSMPWPPFAHDINDMLKAGKDIRQWVQMGLDIALEKPAELPTVPLAREVEPFVCSTCGLDLNNIEINAFIDPEDIDIAYCEPCWNAIEASAQPPVPQQFYRCSKCGNETMRHEPDGLCSKCHWETLPDYVPPMPKPTPQHAWR